MLWLQQVTLQPHFSAIFAEAAVKYNKLIVGVEKNNANTQFIYYNWNK